MGSILRLLPLFFIFASELLSQSNEPVFEGIENCKLLETIIPAVEEIRGLRFKHPVECRETDRQQYLALFKQSLRPFLANNRIESEERVFKAIGLIPEDYPYKECFFKASSNSTVAFFDPLLNAIVMPNWERISTDILAHELVHALQQQHFTVSDLALKSTALVDTGLGMSAIFEGEAIKVQNLFKKAYPERIEREKRERADQTENTECLLPDSLNEINLFVYDFGPLFIDSLKDFAELNEFYRSRYIPNSKEIYFRKLGFRVTKELQPSKFSTLWNLQRSYKLRKIFKDRLGIYVIKTLIAQTFPAVQALRIAKPWVNDSVAVYQDDKAEVSLVRWVVEFESSIAAKDFFVALREITGKRFDLNLKEASRILVSPDKTQSVVLTLEGDTVHFAKILNTHRSKNILEKS